MQQGLSGKFVAKLIVKNHYMTRHIIKNLFNATEESEAVALLQLQANVTSKIAYAKFALKSALPSVKASDTR